MSRLVQLAKNVRPWMHERCGSRRPGLSEIKVKLFSSRHSSSSSHSSGRYITFVVETAVLCNRSAAGSDEPIGDGTSQGQDCAGGVARRTPRPVTSRKSGALPVGRETSRGTSLRSRSP
jgi:hypothetical protein